MQIKIKFLISLVSILGLFTMQAQEKVLQLFNGIDYNPVAWKDIEEIHFETDPNAVIVEKNNGERIELTISETTLFPNEFSIPLIEIQTEEDLFEIPDKENYKKADFKLSGFDAFEDIKKEVNIRGRGNTSWSFPKKPYRLKFDKKISLCGLPAAKSYVLLANYTDCSLSAFALATKIGQMLNLPYTNKVVPVDLKLNGIYKGSYLLTNKPGINAGSVNIDEDSSIMWELDINYDEDYKFISPKLNLPVMAVDPDLTDAQFEEWKEDFINMEKAAVNRNAAGLVDMDILARYVLVYEILDNNEIGYPKSVKLYKTKGEKYKFGPVWDFDVSMGKVWDGECFTTETINKGLWMNTLLTHLTKDPEYKEAYAKYKEEILTKQSELLEFIDDYANTVRQSAIRNGIIWTEMEDFDESIIKMKEWLSLRFEYLKQLQ